MKICFTCKQEKSLESFSKNLREKDGLNYRCKACVSSIRKVYNQDPDKLKAHLESLFEPWMNWENYGNPKNSDRTWHIDHIIPQSKLLFISLEDENFKKCWALENLRPLCAKENQRKGNRIGAINDYK